MLYFAAAPHRKTARIQKETCLQCSYVCSRLDSAAMGADGGFGGVECILMTRLPARPSRLIGYASATSAMVSEAGGKRRGPFSRGLPGRLYA